MHVRKSLNFSKLLRLLLKKGAFPNEQKELEKLVVIRTHKLV